MAYNQGSMVAAAVLLHRATGAPGYLNDARSLANRSLQYFDASGYAAGPLGRVKGSDFEVVDTSRLPRPR